MPISEATLAAGWVDLQPDGLGRLGGQKRVQGGDLPLLGPRGTGAYNSQSSSRGSVPTAPAHLTWTSRPGASAKQPCVAGRAPLAPVRSRLGWQRAEDPLAEVVLSDLAAFGTGEHERLGIQGRAVRG